MTTYRKPLSQFHRDVRWSTRIYTLLAAAIALGAILFDAWHTNWALTIAASMALILFVESLVISYHRHPRTWRGVLWILLLVALALLLIGAIVS